MTKVWPKCLVPWWWMYWWRPRTVLSNATTIKNGLSLIGLEINNSKDDLLIIIINHTNNNELQISKLFQKHPSQFSSLSIPDPNQWQLRGSPLHQESAPLHLEAKTKVFDNIIENLELIEKHQTIFIFKNFLSVPKVIYLLHSAPMLHVPGGTGGIWQCYKNQQKKYVMWLLEKKADHKHPYQFNTEALAFVPIQICFCHVYCDRLIHVRALSTVCFPLLTWNPLIVE